MKAVILAGGLGTRLSEETAVRPKPMVYVGPHPILWHIMKIYETSGIRDFIVCLGYKGEIIKDYFLNFYSRSSDFTIETSNGRISFVSSPREDWTVTLVDTGQESNTGERLLRVKKYLEREETFCLTYGDGLTDASVSSLIRFHETHGKLATLLAVRPSPRFGTLKMFEDQVLEFQEKPSEESNLINGGFFVLQKDVLSMIPTGNAVWETEVCSKLAELGQLRAFTHDGFWQPMDTLRDSQLLNSLWEKRKAPWLQNQNDV